MWPGGFLNFFFSLKEATHNDGLKWKVECNSGQPKCSDYTELKRETFYSAVHVIPSLLFPLPSRFSFVCIYTHTHTYTLKIKERYSDLNWETSFTIENHTQPKIGLKQVSQTCQSKNTEAFQLAGNSSDS